MCRRLNGERTMETKGEKGRVSKGVFRLLVGEGNRGGWEGGGEGKEQGK